MRILVVDDEVLIRTTLARSLSKRAHSVDMASQGTEALNLLNANKYDLVVLDLLMPEKNGFDVLEEMDKSIPVIVISAFSGTQKDEIDQQKYPQVLGFVKKPFENLSDLINYIEKEYANYIG